jgi:enterochelin esterase family protein
MNPLLEKLVAKKKLKQEDVARLAEQHGMPLLEGDRVTFVFWGEADEVRLRHWIFGLPTSQPFHRVDGKPLWYFDLELPEGSRVEYKFEVVRAGHGEWILDPLNPRQARDPFGANSVCHAPGYVAPEWALPDPKARPGRLDVMRIPSRVFGGEREVPIYIPARFRKTGRYPLVVMHDGLDYVRYASLKVVLDNLIHRLEIPAMVVALQTAGDRLREYGADPRHGRHLTEEIVPYLEARLPLSRRPSGRALCGASFGAVASLSTAWQNQGFYGRLLLQSGSFAFSDIGRHGRSAVFDPVAEFVNAFRKDPGKPADRIFISCGTYESLIYENRAMLPVLQRAAIDVRYEETRDGHNWENWRDRLREGLSTLFPGPLWMTYE